MTNEGRKAVRHETSTTATETTVPQAVAAKKTATRSHVKKMRDHMVHER